MFKIFSEKSGSIYVEEIFLVNTIKELMKNYFCQKGFLNVLVTFYKNSVECLEIYFDKSSQIKRNEESNLSQEILFVLTNKFGINSPKMIFIYENRN